MEKGNKLVNAGLGYTIGNILLKGISFLSIPLFTRLMSTVDYGYYNTYATYVSLFAFVLSLGLDPTLKNAEYDYKESKDTYLSTVLYLTLIPFSVLMIAGCCWKGVLKRVLGLDAGIVMLLFLHAEASAIINIYNVKLSLSYASRNYLKIALFNSFCSIVISVALMLTVFTEYRYLGRIIGALVPSVIVAFVVFTNRAVKIESKRFDKSMIMYALPLGLPLIPHLLAQRINSQFDRIMISNMIGYSESGIYSFTYNIAVILQIVYSSLDSVWGPWFFNQMNKKAYQRIQGASNKYIMLVAFLTISLLTISREFIILFAPESYWEGISLVPVLIVGIFMLYLYTLPVGAEYYKKQTKYIAFGSTMTAVLNIVLNYFGIRYYGYKAAAYTTLISYVFLFVVHWNIYRKLMNERLFSMSYIIKCIIAVVFWAFVCQTFASFWYIRYSLYLCIFIGMLNVFKEDIRGYFSNIKRKG